MLVFTCSREGPPLEPDTLVHNSLCSFGFYNLTANCICTAPLLPNRSLHLGLNHPTGPLLSSPAHCDLCQPHIPLSLLPNSPSLRAGTLSSPPTPPILTTPPCLPQLSTTPCPRDPSKDLNTYWQIAFKKA